MRFLQITDTHITGRAPASRLDVYHLSTIRKFMEIGMIIERDEVDVVIHTGDLFHTSRVSVKIVNQLIEVIQTWSAPLYIVPGNHDIDGYNIQTLDQTMLGMLETAGVVKLITREQAYSFFEEGKEIRLEGQEYHKDIDKGLVDDYRFDQPTDFNILCAHGMLLDKPYFPDVPHTLIQHVQTDADMVLCGHYHSGYDEQHLNGTWFFNPGSLMRVECEKREPRYLLFDIERNEQTDQLFLAFYMYGGLASAAPASTIFDFATHRAKKTKKQSLQAFRANVTHAAAVASRTGKQSIPSLINTVGTAASVDPAVIQLALDELANQQSLATQTNTALKGYIEKSTPISIRRVEIKNFQSHEDTTLEFHDGVNVIIGETNSGKSAILRAINWCLYNDPKGTDFITTGKDNVSVNVIFSDGTAIERKRTRKSAGLYRVTSPDGTVTDYQGFSHDVPGSVTETHQMPEIVLAKDVKARLNAATQLEGPFLLSESPQTKAGIVGRLVGTQYVDEAIKELNKRTLANSRQIKAKQDQLAIWAISAKQYENLEQERLNIDLLKVAIEELEQKEALTQTLQKLITDYATLQQEIHTVEQHISALPDAYDLQVAVEAATKSNTRLVELARLLTKHQAITAQLHDTESHLQALPDDKDMADAMLIASTNMQRVIEVGRLAFNLSKQQKAVEQAHHDLQAIPAYNEQELQDLTHALARCEAICEIVKKNEAYELDCQSALSELARTTREEQAIAEQLQQEEAHLSALLQNIEVCPTCGTTLHTKG